MDCSEKDKGHCQTGVTWGLIFIKERFSTTDYQNESNFSHFIHFCVKITVGMKHLHKYFFMEDHFRSANVYVAVYFYRMLFS